MLMRILRRAGYWLTARRHAAELSAEIEHHRARTQEMLEADGLPAAEAAARSRRAMGNVTLAREDARDVWIGDVIERVWRDVKYGARGLRREPMFALTACVTLAVGMAIATTAFSVADAELWKPLPFPDPDALVVVYPSQFGAHGSMERLAGADFLDWRVQSGAFSDLAATRDDTRRVLHRDSAESVWVRPVTANYFRLLGRPALIGRNFEDGDERGARAVMLSERAWRRLFNADRGILGRTVTIDDQPVTIVGVQAGALQFTTDPDVFITIDTAARDFRDRSNRAVDVIGRLRPGVDAAVAQAEMAVIAARIARDYPEGRAGHRVSVSDLRTFDTGYNWRPLYFFLGAAGLVLLLTCVNVAGLVLARALRRGREFALRGALGGGRGALVRQLLVEGALLALPGGALGLLLTQWALGILSRFVPPDFLERGNQVPIDARVYLAAFAVAGLTAIAFGLVPAGFTRRLDLNITLGQGGRTTGRSPGQMRARHLLLAAQVALTVVLVSAAAIFLRSFIGLTRVPLGFDPQNTVALHVTLSGARYSSDAQVRAYAADVMGRARALPGVHDAAIGSSSPLGSGPLVFFVVPGRPMPAPGEESKAIIRSASPDFFRTLGISLMSGRAFTAADADGAPRVAIVNEVLAHRIFPGEDPVGRILDLMPGSRASWARRSGQVTIVGVASNVKEVGMNEIDFNDLYVPFAQAPAPTIELIVRASVPAASLTTGLRALVSAIDRRMPVSSIVTLDQRVDDALQEDRFNLLMVAAFAGAALLLASVGIFGAVAYAVQERRREFGVRIALGAQGRAIVAAAVAHSMRAAGSGALAGIAATLILARVIGNGLYLVPGEHNGLLYGVTTTDPLALASAGGALIAVATLAAVLPARQATRVDPLVALRVE
ncbi:MAG TPA: ABC transporter permease [Vicinamibacterales bacterium]|nr:ABC transporter permease [Vicinamibacterales bacterium]